MITADLKGRAVLVTGGISGIGRAAVELFGRCGAKVAVNYLPGDERGEAVLAEHRAAGLDDLINTAGAPVTPHPLDIKDLDRLDEAFWQAILSTNLLGPFRCAHAAAP